jgi:hypothetical protein
MRIHGDLYPEHWDPHTFDVDPIQSIKKYLDPDSLAFFPLINTVY